MIGQTVFYSIVEQLALVDAQTQQGGIRRKHLCFGSDFNY